MAKSERFEDVRTLGVRIVEELKLRDSVDTLARWMAHHISALIKDVEACSQDDRGKAEDRCRLAIMDLWRHLYAIPGSIDVLQSVPALIRTLRALDPDQRPYFYYSEVRQASDANELTDDTAKWMRVATGIDSGARLLIRECLRLAARAAADKDAIWIDAANNTFATELPAISVLKLVAYDANPATGKHDATQSRQPEAIESLKDKRERLSTLVEMSNVLMAEIDEELAQVHRDPRS